MERRYDGLTSNYDQRLAEIAHYQRYPEMLVAVGAHYCDAPLRVLVLGESHYLDKPEPSNQASIWYVQRDLRLSQSAKNITTRSVFHNAIFGRARSRSKMIFHALANALDECQLAPRATNPLQSIAYMNFFQRPAKRKGKSLLVHPEDAAEATRVLAAVTTVLRPHLVVFASRLAWQHARSTNVPAYLASSHMETLCVPHPATSWWNRPSRPMAGRTGRQRFVDAIKAAKEALTAEGRLPPR